MGGQRHGPTALPPAKTRYPLYRRLGEPQEYIAPNGIRSPDRPVRSESLYRYPCPGGGGSSGSSSSSSSGSSSSSRE